MSHLLVVELDDETAARLAVGECVYPEHPDSRDVWVRCATPEHCNGWLECRRLHICKHGHAIEFDELSIDGPCPGHDDENCIPYDQDEVVFHGVLHTYQWGWGWTVPYPGCVVAAIGEFDFDPDLLPIGEYQLDDDWVDDSDCYLTVIGDAA